MSTSPKKIRAEDGSLLEVKEGIVLNQNGEQVTEGFLEPEQASEHSSGHSENGFRSQRVFIKTVGRPLGWAPALVMGIIIPLLFVAGFAFFGVFLALMLVGFLVRKILRVFR